MITTIIRTVILYLFVTVGIRLMGKRQIGDMQPNELVITLLISEIAAIPLQDTSQPVLNGVAAIFMLVILEIFMSVLALKSLFIRKFMSGNSVVIIKNGIIDQSAMKNVRMTILDLIELLRGQGVFDISTVNYAILEVNGDLSVLLKKENQPVSSKDLKLDLKEEYLPLPVISDGKIIQESLKALNLTEKDLQKKLNKKNLKAKSIFLMTLDRKNTMKIVEMRNWLWKDWFLQLFS